MTLHAKRNRRIVLFSFITILLCIQLINLGTATTNKQTVIGPNGYFIVYEEIDENADIKNDNIILFNYYASKNLIEFESQTPCSIYIMSMDQVGLFLSEGIIKSRMEWTNRTTHQFPINYSYMTTSLNFSTISHFDPAQKEIQRVQFVILIINNKDSSTQISIRYDHRNQLYDFLNQFAGHLLTLGFILLSSFLFYRARIERKAENIEKANFLRNCGTGYSFAALVTILWSIQGWSHALNPKLTWINRTYVEIPIPTFSNNILTYFSLIGLTMAVFFLSWSIEKNIQGRKQPILSFALLISSALLLLGLIWPPIIVYFIWVWIPCMMVSITNIAITYIRVIIDSNGIVRRKALQILLGILIPLICMMIRDFFEPEFMFNIIATIFLLILYIGVI